MPRLSDLQLASMLEEIAAAMRVDMPIADVMQRLRSRRLGSVARTAGRVADQLEQGVAAADAIRVASNPLMDQASAAIASCEQSGDPSLLSSIAAQLRNRYEFSRAARISWLYPCLLLVVAYIVAFRVMAPMVRDNQGYHFHWSPWVVDICNWLEHSWIIPLIVFAVLVLLMVIKQARRRAPKHVRRQLFFRSLADQIQHDVPETDAIHNAALMSGETSLLNAPNLSLESPAILARMSDTDTPFSVVHEVLGNKETLVARLRYASEVHRERAREHDYLWGRLAPRVAMVLAGGGCTVAYAWWIIRPVYQQVVQW